MSQLRIWQPEYIAKCTLHRPMGSSVRIEKVSKESPIITYNLCWREYCYVLRRTNLMDFSKIVIYENYFTYMCILKF